MDDRPGKLTVVLVDDNAQILEATARFLRQREIEVVTSQSAFGVNALLLKHRPQVVVLDVMMAALSGGDLAQIVRGKEESGPPIVFYSAMPEEDLYRLTKKVARSSYVAKADGVDALYTAIARAAMPAA